MYIKIKNLHYIYIQYNILSPALLVYICMNEYAHLPQPFHHPIIPSSPEGTASWSSAFLADSEDFVARPRNGPTTDHRQIRTGSCRKWGSFFLEDTKQSKRVIEVYGFQYLKKKTGSPHIFHHRICPKHPSLWPIPTISNVHPRRFRSGSMTVSNICNCSRRSLTPSLETSSEP